jgi:hypothetical protein
VNDIGFAARSLLNTAAQGLYQRTPGTSITLRHRSTFPTLKSPDLVSPGVVAAILRELRRVIAMGRGIKAAEGRNRDRDPSFYRGRGDLGKEPSVSPKKGTGAIGTGGVE